MSVKPSKSHLHPTGKGENVPVLNQQFHNYEDKTDIMRKIASLIKGRGLSILGVGSQRILDKNVINFLLSNNNIYQSDFIRGSSPIFAKWAEDVVEVTDKRGERSFINKRFALAADEANEDTRPLPLCIPAGHPQLYLGKKNSGPICEFLEKVYP